MSDVPPVAQPDRVPLREVLIYSLGVVGGSWAWAVNGLTNPIFNMELGVNIAWLSTSLAVQRIIDAFTDPIMGHISDNWNSRWGRRRPFVLGGGIAMGVVFALFWMFPHDWPKWAYLIWYNVLSAILYLTTTIFGTGYYALGVELTPDYHDRTRVVVIRSYFQKFAGLAGPWFYAFTQLACFGGVLYGVRWLGAIFWAG